MPPQDAEHEAQGRGTESPPRAVPPVEPPRKSNIAASSLPKNPQPGIVDNIAGRSKHLHEKWLPFTSIVGGVVAVVISAVMAFNSRASADDLHEVEKVLASAKATLDEMNFDTKKIESEIGTIRDTIQRHGDAARSELEAKANHLNSTISTINEKLAAQEREISRIQGLLETVEKWSRK